MATEFSRLYRELCHSGPNDSIKDIYFTRERKQVLKSLGYNIKSEEQKYEISKYHGKGPRRRILEARLKAISSEVSDERKKQLKIRELSRKTQEVNDLTDKIQTLLSENKYVSAHLWSKYDQIYGYETTNNNNNNNTNNNNNKNTKSKNNSIKTPSSTSLVTTQRPRSVIRTDYSKAKWTKEERDRLNYLYNELKRPSGHTIDAWDVYYTEFASQFRVFFGHRSESEVIEKIKDMFANRQFTELGEDNYWQHVRATSPVARQKQLLKSLERNHNFNNNNNTTNTNNNANNTSNNTTLSLPYWSECRDEKLLWDSTDNIQPVSENKESNEL